MRKRSNNTDTYRLNQPLPDNQSTVKIHHHHHFFRWFIGLALLFLGAYGGYNYYQHHQTTTADSPSAIIAFNKTTETTGDKQLTYEYYWKPGCPDCQKVEKAGINRFLKQASLKGHVVTINTTKFKNQPTTSAKEQAHQWFANNYITQVPTLIVKYQGKPIYLYSGTNIKTMRTILNGTNPQTHKAFKKVNPTHETYQNDFNHSQQTFISVDPLDNNQGEN